MEPDPYPLDAGGCTRSDRAGTDVAAICEWCPSLDRPRSQRQAVRHRGLDRKTQPYLPDPEAHRQSKDQEETR
jgi:hypothetical protein